MHHEEGSMKYRYVGNLADGEHLTGIPASHIYEADWDQLTKEQQAMVVADAKRDKPQVFKKVEAESKGATGAKATADKAKGE